MEGFIRNETKEAFFKAQRPLPPGAKLTFEDAHLVFKNKSGLDKGKEFVVWLKENIFTDPGWVFYQEEGRLYEFEAPKSPSKKKSAPKQKPAVNAETEPSPENKTVAPAKGAGKKLVRNNKKVARSQNTAAAIISADLPQAKALIAKTKERGVLKKALSLSNHFANKEEHRRLIQRRLEEVY